MKLKSIVDKSCFSTIATIKEDSWDQLKFFLQYNEGLIRNFKHVIVSINKLEDTPQRIINAFKNTWWREFPNCTILESDVNNGHMFGTIDLEEAILDHVKTSLPEVKYLWKSMDDVISTSDILDLEVDEAEFYYLPGFSYESIVRAGGKENIYKTFETYEKGFWTPQTTFFILNVTNIDSIYGSDIRDKKLIFEKEKARNPYIKPWEIPFDIKFDCETHLGRTTKDLKKYCLIKNQFQDLLDMVDINKVGDPSHKNIYFENIGVCHYHFYKDLIYSV